MKLIKRKQRGGSIYTVSNIEEPLYHPKLDLDEVYVGPSPIFWASPEVKSTDIQDAVKFLNDYYNSEGYKKRARKYGLSVVQIPTNNLFVEEPEWVTDDSYFNSEYGLSRIGTSGGNFSPYEATVHEGAHANPLYNTKVNEESPSYEATTISKYYNFLKEFPNKLYSPYYHNDYFYIPDSYYEILKPDTYNSYHDQELSESYSDLMALRGLLQREGIFDSMSGEEFKNKHYRKAKKTLPSNRFMRLHTKKQVKKAMNEVAQNEQESNINYV